MELVVNGEVHLNLYNITHLRLAYVWNTIEYFVLQLQIKLCALSNLT